MNDPARLWADPRLAYSVAAVAVALLLVTLWLFGRRKRQGRQAAVICLMISIVLHIALLFLVPLLPGPSGGSASVDPESNQEGGIQSVELSSFDTDMTPEDASGEHRESQVMPLPVAELTDLLTEPLTESVDPDPTTEVIDEPEPLLQDEDVPASLANDRSSLSPELMDEIDSQFGSLLEELMAPAVSSALVSTESPAQDQVAQSARTPVAPSASVANASGTVATATAPPASVPGAAESDFANRVGQAKQLALHRTGGNVQTEAAVEAALRFLADTQRSDGAWDPRASGAGRETGKILGVQRPGVGARAESAITGLALLTLMGAGQTHQQGDYADNVYRGLAYLIGHQQPNGSLAGNASPYAANYSHGMAALAMCEAAAITGDAAAVASATRAIQYTLAQQHPSTGGWRYLPGDPGDLSQLGWQAMVLDAGKRAQIPVHRGAVAGIQRFLHSVRRGQTGGLACYRPDEQPSRTMTAEALATRLLIGETLPQAEISEAERYLLAQPPGVGKDNYYYWYYATLALHQLQDDAWRQWNQALQQRLLATQRSDGSWSSETMWGRYGGTVYTTSMAALCLEAYYRHAIRGDGDRIANRPQP